jgi:hypothetical protein
LAAIQLIRAMDEKTFSMFAGLIFAVVALFGGDFEEWIATIVDWSVPGSVSWGALVVAGGLALIGLRVSQR